MRKVCDILRKSMIFHDLDQELYRSCCESAEISLFWKGELIVREGEFCHGLIILLEGQASVQKTAPNGDFSTIELLQEGDSFGEDLLFGKRRHYFLSLEAASNGKYLLLRQEKLLALLTTSPLMLNNVLCSLSDKIQEQVRRVNLLSQRSLRQKVSAYLLGLLRDQLEAEGKTLAETLRIVSTPAVELPISKEMVARLLAMPRPSLSRELIAMEEAGLLRVAGRIIWLLDLKGIASGER